ncbi:glycosyl hydrolase family 18 protein [Paenibacillus pasadenensis]|uniref:glycosyl hydrolase family 18 protein n=1 Tax=Paenibacillus pasadenensis TaxID=217090 RepID=UPI00203CFFF2|nr:glycosyl hydrolase family 18 protein [Paenibacillus pasadenensis]MCM3749002.1 glycosyl hydrolase family 18 protein [Paenibacillus pasadenensis]
MNKTPLAIAAAAVIGLQAVFSIGVSAAPAATVNEISQYRVYQNDRPLKEFARLADAKTFAARYSYSRVERIAGREWIWDNLPRYKVYQNGTSQAAWEFGVYDAALKKARSLPSAQIRDLERPGWVYNKAPRYQLFQNGSTKPAWSFAALDAAKKEAAKWSKAYIIDVEAAAWVWDNYSEAQIKAARAGSPVYTVLVDGVSATNKVYAFARDAAQAARAIARSQVVNSASGAVILSRLPGYQVLQNGKEVASYFALQSAVEKAQALSNSQIVRDGLVWWTNAPYLSVMQGDELLKRFHTRKSAVSYASGFTGSRVVTAENRTLWRQPKALEVLGWSGTSDRNSIVTQLAGTQGVDISSPTWYKLADATGKLQDDSLPELVASLKQRGMKVQPLVHNGFDPKLTSAFLADEAARQTFVKSIVLSLKAAGADGLNLDFESIAGKDRSRYTLFVEELASALHRAGLELSIDLPRGDVAWDHLTAYDHRAIAQVADRIVIMAYDEHWQGGEDAGPVSSLGWAEGGIQQFLSYGIPRSKLVLGIPFYVRVWQVDAAGKPVTSRAVFMKDVPELIRSKGALPTMDPDAGLQKYTYKENGKSYVFWEETNKSIMQRISLAKKYDLAGIAAWRLGYEPEALWGEIVKVKE